MSRLKPIAFIILGVIILLFISAVAAFIYIKSKKQPVKSTLPSPTIAAPMTTNYENPFNEETQYKNPFSKENPFDNLK